MDADAKREQDEKAERARRRTNTYCRRCGGTLSNESPHPLGGNLVVLSCGSCGNEVAMVKNGDRYVRPGRQNRKGIL